MDGQRFDTLVKTLRTRRSALSLIAGIGAILGVRHDQAAAKCKKKCGPCRRCKKGKCKPKPGSIRCGPCSVCQRGRCVAQCPPDECAEIGDEEVCLKECSPPCDTCSECNRVLGQCELMCEGEQCIDGFCDVPCNPPCDPCSYCDFGGCIASCAASECVEGRCEIACDPECDSDEETCVGGQCFPKCDPECASNQACVRGSPDNVCVDLAGNCPDEEVVCQATTCSANGRGGSCVNTDDGVFCAKSLSCGCATDLDCRNEGHGPNSRCADDCAFCAGSGGSGCVEFAGDAD